MTLIENDLFAALKELLVLVKQFSQPISRH